MPKVDFHQCSLKGSAGKGYAVSDADGGREEIVVGGNERTKKRNRKKNKRWLKSVPNVGVSLGEKLAESGILAAVTPAPRPAIVPPPRTSDTPPAIAPPPRMPRVSEPVKKSVDQPVTQQPGPRTSQRVTTPGKTRGGVDADGNVLIDDKRSLPPAPSMPPQGFWKPTAPETRKPHSERVATPSEPKEAVVPEPARDMRKRLGKEGYTITTVVLGYFVRVALRWGDTLLRYLDKQVLARRTVTAKMKQRQKKNGTPKKVARWQAMPRREARERVREELRRLIHRWMQREGAVWREEPTHDGNWVRLVPRDGRVLGFVVSATQGAVIGVFPGERFREEPKEKREGNWRKVRRRSRDHSQR